MSQEALTNSPLALENRLRAAFLGSLPSGTSGSGDGTITLLPDMLIVKILSYLPCKDRIRASECCKRWRNLANSADVWRDCEVEFNGPQDVKNLVIAKKYGPIMERLKVTIDQTYEFNRKVSRKFLHIIAMSRMKTMADFVVRFTGHNPLFYKSTKYVDCLVTLFSNKPASLADSCFWLNSLKSVDFEGLMVAVPDKLLETIAEYHCQIKTINLLDASLVCLISSKALVHFLEACVRLENLALFRACISKKALQVLSQNEGNRSKLKTLTLQFRHDEKFAEQVGEDSWQCLLDRNPGLKMNLIFDRSCQQNRIAMHLMPSLPVRKLAIHSATRLFHEVNLAALYYSDSLEELELKFDVEWALSPTQAVDGAVRRLVACATGLKTLRIFCGLSRNTLEFIREKFFNVVENPRTLLFEEEDDN